MYDYSGHGAITMFNDVHHMPVVPHKATAEVSKIGNL